jgi:heavy metal efflux system protein
MTQPIQMRFNELISGARSDVTVAIYGDDLHSMDAAAKQVAAVVTRVRGAAEVHVGQTHGFPSFDVKFDRTSIARYGLSMEDGADTVAAALGGQPAGLLFSGDRRYQIVVRVPGDQRSDIDALAAIPIMLPSTHGLAQGSVPLRQSVSFGFSEGLNEISRDNGKRRIFVEINVRGRDIASFVADAQSAIAQNVRVPPGAWIEWGGQFKNLQQAIRRLEVVVPVCMALILGALYMALGTMSLALIVFTAVPLALAGGIFAIALRGIPFSISAAVGFIAVSGVAVLNGLVLITSVRRRLEGGEDVAGAVLSGALERFRPVLMTALVASLGFLPMAVATGAGSEVQRPLATVVIGGLITSTALTLFLLPATCKLLLRRRKVSGVNHSDGQPLFVAEHETDLRPAE